MNDYEGIFVPNWVAEDGNLNGNEKLLYSIYYHYTSKGKLGCCKIINEELAKRINVSIRQLKYYKSHLIELGYIHTNGGITVKALKNE